jgi:hypothetical protein
MRRPVLHHVVVPAPVVPMMGIVPIAVRKADADIANIKTDMNRGIGCSGQGNDDYGAG